MRLLLDTHSLLWWSDGSVRLGPAARRMIEDADIVFHSIVSIWEVATKLGTGRLSLDLDDLIDSCRRDGFVLLGVAVAHCRCYAALPLLHRDPFDRMLVAQSLEEGLTLLTTDRRLPAYGVTCVGCD